MNPNPLTPPQNDSIDFAEYLDFAPATSLQNALLATPTSLAEMGEEAVDALSDTREESTEYVLEEEQDMSDEDPSDGGAALHSELPNPTITGFGSSHAQYNEEHQYYDFEEEPSEIMADMSSYAESISTPELHETSIDQEVLANAEVAQPLPVALQDVVQQLQHLQEQAPALHQFPNNSTAPPFSISVIHHPEDSFFPTSDGQIYAVEQSSVESSVSVNALSQHGGIIHTVEVVTSSSPHSLHNEPLSPQTNQSWGDADIDEVEDRYNLSLGDFLYNWATSSVTSQSEKRSKRPSLTELHAQRSQKDLSAIKRRDLQGEDCDVQRIDWSKLGVSRAEARHQRRSTYKNYSNLTLPIGWHSHLRRSRLPDDQDFFRFRKMDFNHEVYLSHFQLRNLVSCASRDNVFYAGRSKIMQWNPLDGTQGPKRVAMNLTNPVIQPVHGMIGGIQVSTLTVEHDILVAGGFCGEYALLNLKAHKSTKHTEGIVTNHENSITNHLQVYLSRTSSSPQVAIASNDNGLRVLDVATNKLVADHRYEHAVNCTAISADGRLRVVVGDSKEVMICHAETGEILQCLEGHEDYGFACDWADDGWTVATGNQDQQIMIWDARKWTTSDGRPSPIATVAAEQAGIRKLKFSPLGSGKRILVAAEPADFVNIIEAEYFSQKQTLNFFGEIGGFDFTNGGRDLIVANCDSMRGGLMEFERCDLSRGSLYESEDLLDRQTRMREWKGYDWAPTPREIALHRSGWGTIESRNRRTTLLGSQMSHF